MSGISGGVPSCMTHTVRDGIRFSVMTLLHRSVVGDYLSIALCSASSRISYGNVQRWRNRFAL